jgi:hypothetical protein
MTKYGKSDIIGRIKIDKIKVVEMKKYDYI